MIVYTHTSQSSQPALPTNPFIFLHVPKTAGTTLWLILRRQYSPRAVLRVDNDAELAAPMEAQWGEVRVLVGHLAYGCHRFPRRPTYVTMLRDPLERILSLYGHWLRCTDTPLCLDDYLSMRDVGTDNCQTRMLAGPEAQALPFGQCDRAVFEEAKRHLTGNIAVAGLTERFDETLMLLERRFGWRLPCYVPENVGDNRIRREALPPSLLRRIWEMTQWDRELYALAAARFEEQIAQEGPSFAASVRRFRIANVQYRRMKGLATGPLRDLKSRLSLDRQMTLESTVRNVLGVAYRHDGWPVRGGSRPPIFEARTGVPG